MSAASGVWSRPVLLVGEAASTARERVAQWGGRIVDARGDGAGRELLEAGFVSLPARAVFDDSLRNALEEFGEPAARHVGTASFEAEAGSVRVPLGKRVVVAGAGSARFSCHGPIAEQGARVVTLDVTVRMSVPDRIGTHLQAINDETSQLARLAAETNDDMPPWNALAITPLVGTLRRWLSSQGTDRRRAFSVAFLESFAPAAVAAKLWEHRFPETEPPS